MSNRFGPESTNPRQRRAYAHAVINQYKAGEATYAEAFEAAYAGSQAGAKGRDSHFGRAVGGVVISAFTQDFVNDTVIAGVLSPKSQDEIAAQREASGAPSYAPDVLIARPDANNIFDLKLNGAIQDPIAEGFMPYHNTNY